MDIAEVKFILSNSTTFNKLNESAIDELILIAIIKEYKKGQIIYKQFDPADYFYFILKGKVVASVSYENKEIEIDLLKRCMSFGIISLFTDQPHSITAKAIETSYILIVEKEKFKQFLTKYPNISLDFSRMLSQRVRAQEARPKKIFQFRRIAILGFSSSGKTTYLYKLCKVLKKVTNRKVIGIEISLTDTFMLPYFIKKEQNALLLSKFDENKIFENIISDDADYLLLKLDTKDLFGDFLNFISENYHFIIYEVPSLEMIDVVDEFIDVADYIDFILFSQLEELKRSSIFIGELKNKYSFTQDRIRVLVNEFGSKDNLLTQEKLTILDHPIYATLPPISTDAYDKAITRISRQLGEVVVGLALGSGAAYGFSHIGVLKVLEEHNVTVDLICGTSMGSVIAALWALGYKIFEIERLAKEFGKLLRSFSFFGFSIPFRGLIRSKHLEHLCKKIFGNKSFYDVKHALKIVAFDFVKKQTTVIDSGPIYKAVAASCAMPGIFEPVKFKEELLLDGGILNPLPTKILLNYNVNRVIAVNITPTQEEIFREYKKRNKHHIFDFIFGSIETMQREFINKAVSIADVVIHPNLEGIGWMEFEKVYEIIERGKLAAIEKIEEIKKLECYCV
ncbi:MAG: patatin-like phospholipase family protein [Candidatus Omnitrophica bacterium]|nr:patatin-like phospholipase family protein [Candidatus Omnitrophota bacterium]